MTTEKTTAEPVQEYKKAAKVANEMIHVWFEWLEWMIIVAALEYVSHRSSSNTLTYIFYNSNVLLILNIAGQIFGAFDTAFSDITQKKVAILVFFVALGLIAFATVNIEKTVDEFATREEVKSPQPQEAEPGLLANPPKALRIANAGNQPKLWTASTRGCFFANNIENLWTQTSSQLSRVASHCSWRFPAH